MSKWNFYTTNEIKPHGWLRRQLEIQAEGLSGNLHKVWRDVRESSWIGGDAEGWERVPYWLDGFIPLAYLLENEEMIAVAKRYMDAIISAQKPDGWICPCADEERAKYDTWAVLLITKVLTVYYECSGDERVPEVIYRTLRNYYELLRDGHIKLFGWGEYRWFEGFVAINFIYERYPEEWLVRLAEILKEQGKDYTTITHLWEKSENRWQWDTHIVNLGMMLKYEAVSFDILGEEYTDRAEELFQKLLKYNGTPLGLFTGDECLGGLSPIHGTELCAVVEQMYSYELLYACTGDEKWARRLEVLAFNALPATISDDMWAHQYDQMSNQIACVRLSGKSVFTTNGINAHLFGLEPEYGCCTANFNQGWPKFALSAFVHKDNTIMNVVPIPSELDSDIAHIKLETNYPFENRFRYTAYAKKDLVFKIRIPDFARCLCVNGETVTSDELVFELSSGESREISVSFDTEPYFEKRPYDLNTVKCGSLVFSVPIKYEKRILECENEGDERRFPHCDYEYLPRSEWSYAYNSTDLAVNLCDVSDIPFSSEKPPVTVKAKVKKIPWGFHEDHDTVCAKVPLSREAVSGEEEILLYPYGCAKLRMTELPLID